MKQKVCSREILLITGTSFSNRPFSRSNTDNNDEKSYSAIEELEKACWDGMMNELLPELAGDSSKDNKNFIWNIVTGDHFLCIRMGPSPMQGQNETSIDPHLFLCSVLAN